MEPPMQDIHPESLGVDQMGSMTPGLNLDDIMTPTHTSRMLLCDFIEENTYNDIHNVCASLENDSSDLNTPDIQSTDGAPNFNISMPPTSNGFSPQCNEMGVNGMNLINDNTLRRQSPAHVGFDESVEHENNKFMVDQLYLNGGNDPSFLASNHLGFKSDSDIFQSVDLSTNVPREQGVINDADYRLVNPTPPTSQSQPNAASPEIITVHISDLDVFDLVTQPEKEMEDSSDLQNLDQIALQPLVFCQPVQNEPKKIVTKIDSGKRKSSTEEDTESSQIKPKRQRKKTSRYSDYVEIPEDYDFGPSTSNSRSNGTLYSNSEDNIPPSTSNSHSKDCDYDQYENVDDPESLDNDNSSKRRSRSNLAHLTDAEKYRRVRQQNNIASRKSRNKKKNEVKDMEQTILDLERENRALVERYQQLKALRDNYKSCINLVNQYSKVNHQ